MSTTGALSHRIIVGTETFPTNIDVNWRLVEESLHVIGDFTWTGWDYLGEAGIGRMQYPTGDEPSVFAAPYPWLTAWCGDIDITGLRRPASYYREIVFGLRHEPYIAVQRPQHHGAPQHASAWTWTDSISSWSWNTADGSPVTVEVYSDAEEVELLLNGQSVGRAPAGRDHRFRSSFELDYQPGELTAVAIIGGEEVSRTSLYTPSAMATLAVTADREQLTDNFSDLSFVTIELRDDKGVLITDADRIINVDVRGAGALQGLGSARPDTTEKFDAHECTTFDGRILGIIRPTGVGEITVDVTTDGTDPVRLTLRVSAVPTQSIIAP